MNNEDNFDSRLKELEEKIQKVKSSQDTDSKNHKSGINGEKVFAELIAGILFGLFIGYYLDDYFDTKPLFMLILIILGLAGSFYNIYKEAVKDSKQDKS